MSTKVMGYQAPVDRMRSTPKVSGVYGLVADRNATNSCHNSGSGNVKVKASSKAMPLPSNEANWNTCPVRKVTKVVLAVECYYVKNGKPGIAKFETVVKAMEFGASCDSFQVCLDGSLLYSSKPSQQLSIR